MTKKPLTKFLYGITDNTIGKYIAVPMKYFPIFYKILDKDGDIVARFVNKSYIENTYGWHRERRDYVTLPHRVAVRAEEIKDSMNGIMERWVKQVENGREAVKNIKK